MRIRFGRVVWIATDPGVETFATNVQNILRLRIQDPMQTMSMSAYVRADHFMMALHAQNVHRGRYRVMVTSSVVRAKLASTPMLQLPPV